MGKTRTPHEFSATVKRQLERRVGCVCSKPGCGRVTCGPHTDADKATSVGNAGHITSAAPGGPRYDAALTPEQRGSIENGIWLCVACHAIVDNDESPFGADELRRWKVDAEARAREVLELARQRDHVPRVISILHRSMEHVPDRALAASLPRLLQHVANREVVVDGRELIGADGPRDDGDIAARQLRARDEVWQLMGQHPDAELAYYGIAHVPLAVHLGCLLGTRCSVQYAERDRDRPTWHWIANDDREFPPLERAAPTPDLGKSAEVAVAVSISYRVTDEQIVTSIGPMPIVSLSVPAPGVDLVHTRTQVEAYSKVFRDVLEQLARAPAVRRVHVFAATPMSISFALGRQVRPTVHPDVHVYNYFRPAKRPYPWGLRLRDASVVRPSSSE